MPPNYIRQIDALDDDELERFVDDWQTRKATIYMDTERYSGAGDMGRDVVGFLSNQRLEGAWHNFQCKQLKKTLTAPPGFIVLDTPLLTYRSPLKNPKHGELSEDEKSIKETSLQNSFYDFIVQLKGEAQIIILENEDPPESSIDDMQVVTFTGDNSVGRFGFFPVAD